MRPRIPIMQWIMSNPKSNRIGHAQEQSIIKWKWYISERAKQGEGGVASLHEKIADIPVDGVSTASPQEQLEESPVKWGKPYSELSDKSQCHTWFTDGSARYVAGRRKWRSVAFNPRMSKTLKIEGEGKSSQYAELFAVYLALRQEIGGECNIYTDSWSVANGLATWMMSWKKHDWKIHGKELWGKEVWEDIEVITKQTKVTVFHVDAHVPLDSLERLFNSQADAQAAIAKSSHEPVAGETKELESWLQGTALWAHQKSGHLGEKATYRLS
ncbi:ribonuclease H1-like [Pseudophryne corroboree]|uniref:ribonuclease H1-like n=1 Tax=Pseudophryne corroboree TaxID=495146 RepID=UPI0030821084